MSTENELHTADLSSKLDFLEIKLEEAFRSL